MNILPLPELPPMPCESPQIVRVLDDVRYRLFDQEEDSWEFYWFAREYGRIFRHHVDHVEHRLRAIHDAYAELHQELGARLLHLESPGETILSCRSVRELYWDFEAFLSAASSSLDAAARVVGPAYETETPLSFNKFRRKAPAGPLRGVFERAAERWVLRLKDYRDCFVHFTPADTLMFIGIREYSDGWELLAPIPRNPNAREILLFRRGRRYDVLKYATTTWRHLRAFDRAIAHQVWSMFQSGRFPVRTEHLFAKGGRIRPQPSR